MAKHDGSSKSGSGDGYAVGGQSGRGAGHPDGWNPSRGGHIEPTRSDGSPLVEGVDYDGFGVTGR